MKSETVFCPLSERELQALRFMAEGMTAKDMAREAGSTSYRTWEIHRRHMIEALEAKNCLHALSLGFRMGLIQ